MKTIKNYELKIRRVAVSDAEAPYGVPLTGPEAVTRLARQLIGDAAQESFLVFLLDIKNRVIGFTEAGRGAVDSCPVDPRVVFRTAVALGASSIIVAHNHPSGDPAPSSEDVLLTKRLMAGARLLGLELLDHVVVTDTGAVSLRQLGLM